MKISIRSFAERLVGPDGPYAHAFNNLILALIVISIFCVFLEATINIPPWAVQVLWIAGIVGLNHVLVAAQRQLQAELDVAQALQLAILPSAFPAMVGCDGAARMIPATTTGGDVYDVIELPDQRVALVLTDVSAREYRPRFSWRSHAPICASRAPSRPERLSGVH